MVYQIPNIKLFFDHSQDDLKKEVSGKLGLPVEYIRDMSIKRKSLDARKKPEIYYVYTLLVTTDYPIQGKFLKKSGALEYQEKVYQIPELKSQPMMNRPIIVGAGPAGLFCGLVLARAGANPIILERGQDAHSRKEAIENFYVSGQLNIHSNVTFGEGGAGTFSDGKLNSGVKDKFFRKDFILKTLVDHGADESVLYMAKPHVGTDYLVDIVAGIRKEIISLGGRVYFNHLVEDIEPLGHGLDHQEPTSYSLKVLDLVKGNHILFVASHLILAIGHSARDTFRMLVEKDISIEPKPFAIGVRVEHPQSWINRSQYGDKYFDDPRLPAAEYKLTHQTLKGRGVYSFCMCPGGEVVNASSTEGECVCNGMSLFARDNHNANSAIIVTVKPEDFGGDDPLAGVRFQEKYERQAFDIGHNHQLITQTYEDFYKSVMDKPLGNKSFMRDGFYQVEEIKTTCRSPLIEWYLKECLPQTVAEAIAEGMEAFGHKIKGFDHPKTRMIGVETRTSSPIRILRNDHLVSSMPGVYPCGEGAGYAGGIMSAAIDGMKVAEQILSDLRDRLNR